MTTNESVVPLRGGSQPVTMQRPAGGVDLWQPQNLEQAMKLAELVANSDMVPKDFKGRPGNVLIAMQMGRELGMQPLMALQNIAVINGRPAVWGDLQLAIVQQHPAYEAHKEDFDEETMTAVCTVKRRGQQPHTARFSQKDAEAAKLWTKDGPWKQYPKRMLQLRARAFALRDTFSDALKGVAQREEAMDIPVETTVLEHEPPGTQQVHLSRTESVKDKMRNARKPKEEPQAPAEDPAKRRAAGEALKAKREELGYDEQAVLTIASDLAGKPITAPNQLSTEQLEKLTMELDMRGAPRSHGSDGAEG